ncbi:MAG: Crp/Fnr family transcriptional regulator [Xanthobacteraceae bacterium]
METSNFLELVEPATREAMNPHLRPVPLDEGTCLHEAGADIDYVYFPTQGIVTLLTSTQDGHSVGTGLLGREGIVGSSLSGSPKAMDAAVVQVPGAAYRLPSRAFKGLYDENPSFRSLIDKYNRIMWGLAQQCAACNALHPLRGRLARWLLHMQARTDGVQLRTTQANLADLLGVRRTSVTLEENRLQGEGLIKISRGQITILNLDGLLACACECYDVHERRISHLTNGSA